MPEGPLGFPRLTTVGPLSKQTEEEVRSNWDDCPVSGVEREVCRSVKRNSIRVLEGEFEDNLMLPPCSTIKKINAGACGAVASEVYKELGFDNREVKMMEAGLGDHFWISYKGKHYDAESPTGVNSPEELPVIQRKGTEMILSSAQEAAKFRGDEPPDTFAEVVKDVSDEAEDKINTNS